MTKNYYGNLVVDENVKFQKEMLKSAKRDFDEQLNRFSKIWCKEVMNRKRKTKRGVIAEEVLVNISRDIFSDRPYFISYRRGFENAYNKKDWVAARRIVDDLKDRLNNYKEVIRRGKISWYGC